MRRAMRMTTFCWLLFAPMLFGGLALAQTTAPVNVDAVCVGPDGKPVVGAEFADRWSWAEGAWRASFLCPNPQAPLRLCSDADGRIAGTWTFSPAETPLFGLSADRSLALRVVPMVDAATHRLEVRGTLTMARAVRVRGTVRAAALTSCRLAVRWPAPESDWSATFCFVCDRAAFDLPLPPGSYGFVAGAGHGAAPSRTLLLAEGRDVLDVGEIRVPLPAFDLLGEVLPDWHVTAAKNLPPEQATLAHFRGAPLLLHFDDFGFPPRLEQGVRDALAKLDRHPARARFHVVLFGPVRNRLEGLPPRPQNAEWDRLFPPPKPGEPAVETMFPLLSDDSGATERLYGSTWGTAVLDRDGRLCCYGSLADAIAALERLLGEAR